MKTKPRPVDFLNSGSDFDVAFLGSLGFSSKFITDRTGLTSGQIGYRLKKAHIRRLDYRNGTSHTAKTVLSAVEDQITKDLQRQLHDL